MNKETYIKKAAELLGRLVHETKMKNAVGLFDINRISEDFYIPILSILFECEDLVNQNRLKHNFPAVDLGSNNTRQSFQVSSDASSAKIIETIQEVQIPQIGRRF